MSVKKIDLIKIAEEALQTAFPRVSFGPPGAGSPLEAKKMKSNLLNSDMRKGFGSGSYMDYAKSIGGAKPDTLTIPGVDNQPKLPERDANNIEPTVAPTFGQAYGGRYFFKPFLYKAIEHYLPPNLKLEKTDAYKFGDRARLYNTIKKDIMSKPFSDPTRKTYEQEIENMRRYGMSNRSTGGFRYITNNSSRGPAALPHVNPKADVGTGEFGKILAKVSPAMLMPANFKGFAQTAAKQAPVLSTVNPDAIMLHELEHTNQIQPDSVGHTSGFRMEIPAVASEIAHMSEAYRAATGKYPEGKYLGIPYGDLAQLAVRDKHIYGNQPMTTILNKPENQQRIKDFMVRVKQNQMLEDYVKKNPGFYNNAARAGGTVFGSVFPGLDKATQSSRKMYEDYLRANPPQGTYMPNFNPNYGALQSESGGLQRVPRPESEPVKQQLKSPKFEKVNGRTSEEIERMLREKILRR